MEAEKEEKYVLMGVEGRGGWRKTISAASEISYSLDDIFVPNPS